MLPGLFALLQVINEIERREKKQGKKEGQGGAQSSSNGSTCNSAGPEQTSCANKLCTERCPKGSEKGWARRKIGENMSWLCKNCTSAYGRKQYCDFCKQIYMDPAMKESVLDGLEWIQCGPCKRWTHVKCEAREDCADIQAMLLDPLFKYTCPTCKKAAFFGKKKGNV